MLNDFGEAIAAFVAMPETRQTAQPKELYTTNVNWKGAAPHRKIGLPLNRLVYFCNCESNHRFAAIISFDCVSIIPPSQVLTIIYGKIFCERYQL